MEFNFPIPPGYENIPVWIGKGFKVGSENLSVLKYNKNEAGWNADLTEFHETEAENGNHFIDRASRLHACMELKKYAPANGVVLEIGSSSGFLLRDMKKAFPDLFIIGSDCISEPLEKIAKNHPEIPLIQFDLVNCPLPDNCVDVIIALNVLEHIEDDVTALEQIYRILKPGGHAIIEVPANPDLYDFYDEQLKHFRRYSLKELCYKTEIAGFILQKSSHLGFFVYPGFQFMKRRNKKEVNKSNEQMQGSIKKLIHMGGPAVNNVIYFLMLAEIKLGKMIKYPFGIRCLIILQK